MKKESKTLTLVKGIFAYIGSVANTLTLIFVTLKLTDLIDWSWWLVLIPFFVQWGIIVVLLLVGTILLAVLADDK